MEQRVSLPIVMSLEHDVSLALWTVIVPSTAFLLGYQFIIKPRRRLKRLAWAISFVHMQDELICQIFISLLAPPLALSVLPGKH